MCVVASERITIAKSHRSRVFISRSVESCVCLKIYGLREHEFGAPTYSGDCRPKQILLELYDNNIDAKIKSDRDN